jgi:hypothetical protein
VYFYICEGITEPGAGNDLAEVFPDPVADRLYIRTNGVPVRTIRIYNITGQLLQDIHWPADNSINVSGLPSGAYFSEIRIGNEWKKSRWIKL